MLVYFGLLFTNLNTAYHVYEAVSNNGGTLHTDKIIRLFTEFIQACIYVVKKIIIIIKKEILKTQTKLSV